MSSSPEQEDMQWFGSLSSNQLLEYVSNRATIHFRNVPQQSTITVDARAYQANLNTVRGLHPFLPHLVTISTASPTAPLGIFILSPSPSDYYEIIYDDTTVTLSLIQSKETKQKPPPPGSRGVAVLSAPAESRWKLLSNFITTETLSFAQIEPSKVIHSPPPQFLSLPTARRPRRRPNPTDFNNNTNTSNQLTQYHLDRTEYVRRMVTDRYQGNPNQLLAELQLSFLCFTILANADALEHWSRLIREISRCDNLINLFKDMKQFADLVAIILKTQFTMVDNVNNGNLIEALSCEIHQCLACFVSSAWERPIVKEFTKYVNQLMGWNLTGITEEGDDQDGPVVVNSEK